MYQTMCLEEKISTSHNKAAKQLLDYFFKKAQMQPPDVQKHSPEAFCKKGVLKIFANFTGKHLCWSLFFNKVACLQPASFLRRASRTPILKNICKQLLLEVRSSRPEAFCKKGVPRNFTKFTGKHLCQSLRPATLLKMKLWNRYFPVNFVKFLRTLFSTEHLWWLLLGGVL